MVAGGVVSVCGQVLRASSACGADGPRLLMLRPERLEVLKPGAASSLNVLDARFVAIVYQGDSSLMRVALSDGSTVAARCPSERGDGPAARPGDPLCLGFAPEDTILLPADVGGR
jgi:putative spermidine/putrescine transport system ATP-binding protein